MITAVILAAGNSSRMGYPKAILEYNGKTFIETIIENLKKAEIYDIAVVLGKDKDEILKKWKPSGVQVFYNFEPELGQIHSLRIAIKGGIKSDILLCLVDQPLVKAETYREIVKFSIQNLGYIIIPKCLKEFSPGDIRYKRGHPIVIPYRYQNLCLEGPIEKGLHWVTHHPQAKVLDMEVNDEGILKDFDTPQDFKLGIRDEG